MAIITCTSCANKFSSHAKRKRDICAYCRLDSSPATTRTKKMAKRIEELEGELRMSKIQSRDLRDKNKKIKKLIRELL
jgi:hypothetical protein